MNNHSNVSPNATTNKTTNEENKTEAKDWFDHAENLAVNWLHRASRFDTYGRYTSNTTFREKKQLAISTLISHFRGTGDRVGFYTTHPDDDMCKFCCIDIDAHKEAKPENWQHAESVANTIRSLGMFPLVEDSNGNGGYKIWIFWQEPVSASIVYPFVNWLIKDLPEKPETFPKQATIKKKCGNYVRLPGRHHKRNHWSKFHDGRKWHDGLGAVIECLRKETSDASLIPDEAKKYKTFSAKPSKEWTLTDRAAIGSDNWLSDFTGDLKTLDIVSLFEDANMLCRSAGNAWEVQCPWRNDHTTGDSAFIFPNEGSYPNFFCHHSHCKGKGLREVCYFFGAEMIDSHCEKSFSGIHIIPDAEQRIADIFVSKDKPHVEKPDSQTIMNDPRTAYLWQGNHAKDYNISEDGRIKRASAIMAVWDYLPDGFLTAWLRTHLPTTDASVWFLLGAGLSVLSQLVNRKRWTENGGRALFPNLYQAHVAPSGRRKSTGVNLAKRHLTSCATYCDCVMGGDTTWAAMAKSLGHPIESGSSFSQMREQLKSGERPSGLVGIATMHLDEISGWLETVTASHNAGFRQQITSLYDCPDQLSKDTSSQGSYLIWRPCLSIIGATTLDWLQEQITATMVSGGFYARWLFMIGEEPAYILNLCDPPDKTYQDELDKHTDRICSMSSCKMSLSPDAEKYYCEWSNGLGGEADLESWLTRYRDYAWKLALLFEVSKSDTDIISAESMTLATRFVDKLLCDLKEFLAFDLGTTDYEKERASVCKFLRTRKGEEVSFGRLVRGVYPKLPMKRVRDLIDTLHCEGLISLGEKILTKNTRLEWLP